MRNAGAKSCGVYFRCSNLVVVSWTWTNQTKLVRDKQSRFCLWSNNYEQWCSQPK